MTERRALVCGASQGIGEAVALELAARGCRVVVLARSRDKLQAVAARLVGTGHRALATDLDDLEATTGAVADEINRGGPIHIFVNNSGGPKPGPVAEALAPEFEAGFRRHVLAASALVRQLLPGMRDAGFGRVINIISTSVKVPIPNLGVSNTIRAAVANWAKTLSLELGPFGITVNNILPGFTMTPRLESLIDGAAAKAGKSREEIIAAWQATIPARRFGEPREVAAAAGFLASPAAAYVNGINLPVDGGRTGSL